MREKHGALYSRRGAGSLVAGSLAGWLSGVIVELPHPVVGVLFGLVAGGVIANTVISELAREKQGRFGPSLMGAALCTAVLLLAG